jgi:hypothetical protein
MNATALLSTTLALATACMQPQDDGADHPVRRALPTAAEVRIELPEAEASARRTVVGQIADYYVLTRNTTRELNGVTAWVLLVVHTIVQFPATSVDGDVAVWGPWSDALDPAEYRLTVTSLDDGTFDWQLDGRSKTEVDATFLTVIAGHAAPSDPIGHGQGTFAIDFAAAEAVNPIDNDVEQGTADFAYDLREQDGLRAQVTIHGEGFDDADTPASFDYAYRRALDGGGDFGFAVDADLAPGEGREEALIVSRWQPDGAGRADASLSGGDLEGEATAVECWDTTFRRVYYADSVGFVAAEGTADACAYADAP